MTTKIDPTKYPNLSRYLDPEIKAKIDILMDFMEKPGVLLCTKHTCHVDQFGDTDTSYTELSIQEREKVVMRFLHIDTTKLEEERRLFIDNELSL